MGYTVDQMCGRFTNTADLGYLQTRFNLRTVDFDLSPRYNIAPTQEVLTVTNDGSQNQGQMMRWGLIPFWAKDKKIGNKMINAGPKRWSRTRSSARYSRSSDASWQPTVSTNG